MFGRRDRCLLVLSQLAGVPYRHLATLTAGDITVVDGIATITAPAGGWTVASDDDPVICGCRARHPLAAGARPGGHQDQHRRRRRGGRKAEAVTGESPHLCRSSRELDDATAVVPLLPPIDQWGALPFPSQPLTPHSLSRRVRDLLAGDLGAHRHLPVDQDDEEPRSPNPFRSCIEWGTAGGTHNGRGIDDGPTLRNWAASRKNSPTSIDAPTNSTDERPHCSPNTGAAPFDSHAGW